MTEINHEYPDLIDYQWMFCSQCDEEYMSVGDCKCPICLEEMEEI